MKEKERSSTQKVLKTIGNRLKSDNLSVRTYFHSGIQYYFDSKSKKITDFILITEFLRLLKGLDDSLTSQEIYNFIKNMRISADSDKISIEKLNFSLGRLGFKERFKASEALFLSRLSEWLRQEELSLATVEEMVQESDLREVEEYFTSKQILVEDLAGIPVHSVKKGGELDWKQLEKVLTEFRELTVSPQKQEETKEQPKLAESQSNPSQHYSDQFEEGKVKNNEDIVEADLDALIAVEQPNRAFTSHELKLIEQPSLLSKGEFVDGKRNFTKNLTVINYKIPFEEDILIEGEDNFEVEEERNLVFNNGTEQID